MLLRRKGTLVQSNTVTYTTVETQSMQAIWCTNQDTSWSTQTMKNGTGKSQMGWGQWVTDTCDAQIKTHHSQHKQWRMGQENLKWDGAIGSLTHVMHKSRHIIVNMNNEEWDREISNGMRPLGHWHIYIYVMQTGSASYILVKNRLMDMSSFNYAPMFTHSNKAGLSLLICSEVHTLCQFFYWGCQNQTAYEAWPWTLTHWNWHGCRHAVSNSF